MAKKKGQRKVSGSKSVRQPGEVTPPPTPSSSSSDYQLLLQAVETQRSRLESSAAILECLQTVMAENSQDVEPALYKALDPVLEILTVAITQLGPDALEKRFERPIHD